MDVIAKAHELAEALANSSELLRYRAAEARLLNNSEAQVKLQELRSGNLALEKIEDPVIYEYLSAYREFSNLLEAVKFILTSAYDGELTAENGCGHCCRRNFNSPH
ncbi:YlbF family regulator [Zhaonella formicivorans]|uniref:YlbF family regulator n=1 Tax=Zhaonella formicivorans TaxID=2528593 RepID=UPI001D10E77D|nr:YlbF family regulator [Zhaonella formicivorans]